MLQTAVSKDKVRPIILVANSAFRNIKNEFFKAIVIHHSHGFK